MDQAKRDQIDQCGNCHLPEDAHQHRTGTDLGDLAIFAALGGACVKYVASDASVIVQKHLAITNNRAPQRRADGRLGKRLPIHQACGNRHQPGSCPLGVASPVNPEAAAAKGAGRAREALARVLNRTTPEASS